MKMTLAEIARVVKAQPLSEADGSHVVTGLAFDSRKLKPGMLFVPLRGERDGHEFIPAAATAGAVATFVAADHLPVTTKLITLVVPDPLKAMQQLAQYYLLMKVNPKVVAITGSNGKTTTKDMTAAILATQYHVVKTPDNYNNEIGVPMTILSMEPNTEVLVLEMGMDRPGQLPALSTLAEPDVAVITMIGEAHIEFFKTRDKIADAKMEITDGLKDDGTFIFNGDEPLLQERAKKITQERETFGLHPENTIFAHSISGHRNHTEFTVEAWPDLTFSIPIMGEYNVVNALAALLVGRKFHVKPEIMQKALAHFQVTANRTQWLIGDVGEQILSDVYNANPTAMKAVIHDFSEFTATGRHIAVLGDMLELGEQSPALHAGLAEALDPKEVQVVYLYGSDMKALADALAAKYPADQLHYYPLDDKEQMTRDLQNDVSHDDMVLLKASHGLHLETVLSALVAGGRA